MNGIADINSAYRSYRIVARVVVKSSKRQARTGGYDGDITVLRLADRTGVTRAVLFQAATDKHFNSIRQDLIYEFKGFKVLASNGCYTSVKHRFEIIIQPTTEIF